jgi:parallel beta-helix repeat protein/predicted outer membrane repeat protein
MRYFIVIVTFFILTTTSHATIWYVDGTNTTPPWNGTQADPFQYIQDGINKASDGDTVLVLPYTYVENINFFGKNTVVRSDEDGDPATYDIAPDTTIIDGGNPLIPDLASAVFFENGETQDAELNGFTITNGTGKNVAGYGRCGGGIYCYGSSPKILNNKISNWISGNSADYGGGICCRASSSPFLSNNTITGNSASSCGGGIYCDNSSPMMIQNTSISENSAKYGGGIYCDNSSPPISSCTINMNTATYGGGIYCSNNSYPIIQDSDISGNSAYDGGGIFCVNCDKSVPTLSSCTIIGNVVSACGGGVYCNNSSPTLTTCTITDNTANYGGGIFCKSSSSPSISTTVFTGNTAFSKGGGICCNSSSPPISTCTITDNTASHGGGIFFYSSTSSISISTITGNTASNHGGGIYCEGSSSPSISTNIIAGNTASNHGGGIYCYYNSSPTIQYSYISGNSASHGGGIYCDKSSSPSILVDTVTGNSASYYGGGIYCYDNSSPAITNTVIAGNTADIYGGGIDCEYNSSLMVMNGTIIKNFAGLYGGGLHVFESFPTVKNTIVWCNKAFMGDQIYDPPGNADVDFCCVKGGWPGINIDEPPEFPPVQSGSWTHNGSYNPQTHQVTFKNDNASWIEDELVGKLINSDTTQWLQFVIIANSDKTVTVWADWATINAGTSWVFSGMNYQIHDYHLTWTSPCVNRGTNIGAPPDDIDGDSRPNMGTVDMGADEFNGIHSLEADVFTLPEGGGTVNFILNGGLNNAGRNYHVLGSITGTIPGILLPGGKATLPLNWDIFTNIIIPLINTTVFKNFMGTLDGQGSGTAQLNLPPAPGAAGTTMYFAYALNNPWNFVSNPVGIEIVP